MTRRIERATVGLPSSFLPHEDPGASLAFWRDTLGFEVRNDVGYGKMCWIPLGPADQPEASSSIEVSTR
jgi:hypothetical protein